MALTAGQQLQVRAWMCNFYSRMKPVAPPATVSILKSDIDAAVSATDTWITNNQASFNSALPAAFQALTLSEKTLLFCVVAMLRAGLTPP